jgi:hypothetical protein
VLVFQPPVLVLVSEKKFCLFLIKRGKKISSSNAIQFQLVLQHPVLVLSLSHQKTRKRNKSFGDSFVNVYLRLRLTCHLLSAICCCRLYLCRSQEWALHSPSLAGFVYLAFSWPHAPFVFSSIHSYQPVAIAVFFYLQFMWRGALLPLSGGVCLTSASVTSLLLSKHTGGGGVPLASSLTYSSREGVLLPHSPELRVPCPLC